jgi:hypothetical protein
VVVIFSFCSKQDKVSDKDTKPCVVLYLSSGHFATKYEGDGGDEKKHKHHKQHYSSLFFPGTDISDGLKINVVNETAISKKSASNGERVYYCSPLISSCFSKKFIFVSKVTVPRF